MRLFVTINISGTTEMLLLPKAYSACYTGLHRLLLQVECKIRENKFAVFQIAI